MKSNGYLPAIATVLILGLLAPCQANYITGFMQRMMNGGRQQTRVVGTGGCPNDPFLLVAGMNIPGGVAQSHNDLETCLQQCLFLATCVAVDYDNGASQPNGFKCYFHTTTSVAGSMIAMAEVNHYTKVDCTVTAATSAGTAAPTASTSGAPTVITAAPTTLAATSVATSGATSTTTAAPVTTAGTTVLTTVATVTPATGSAATTTASSCTATIPDSGCPNAFQKFENFAHPFGQNVTSGTDNDDAEKCKLWCLNRPFCLAVDFDTTSNTCYYHANLDLTLVASLFQVNHYRKISCAVPVKCWQESNTLSLATSLSVTNSTTTQVDCNGFCYVRQTVMSTETVLDRGCWSSSLSTSGLTGDLGCVVDPSSVNATNAVLICFCDTDRCNGLSITALASTILYMPLNGDMSDHSGMNRDGVTALGYTAPLFNCFDAIENCSAQFLGSQCISVQSLIQANWGIVTVNGEIENRASFSVWAKRISDGSTDYEGIFGNSIDSNEPTWRIIGEASTHELVSSGIDTEMDSEPTLLDYPAISAPSGTWHLLTMVYDGRTDFSITPPLVPTLNFYVDGVAQSGNMRADNGSVIVRTQPVGIGCVQLKNFTGFIDEARIFVDSVGLEDINAMLTMRDSNFA